MGLNAMQTQSDIQNVIVGLDIGTSKVTAVAAAVMANSTIEILGVGSVPCDGLRRGVVTNINRTTEAIKAAVDQASKQSGYQLGKVVAGISGEHIATSITRGVVTTATNEVAVGDLQRLHRELRQVSIPQDRKILHVIPQEYLVDGHDEVDDPLGMSGRRLEANALVITAQDSAYENLKKSIQRADLFPDAIVLQPLANSYSVLSQDERELGVALVDIGAGTTDVAVFKNNVLRFVAVVGYAGQKVTDDIVAVLSIRPQDAERVKCEYGRAMVRDIKRDEIFQIPGVAGRTPTELSTSIVAQIIEPRMEEILEMAKQELSQSGLARTLQSGVGVVLTGGGSQLIGTLSLADKVYRLPVGIGYPSGFAQTGLASEVKTPEFGAAIGLILYAVAHNNVFDEAEIESALLPASQPTEQQSKEATSPVVEQQSSTSKPGIVGRVRDWLENL
jgi:cell division protein FtsA